MSRRARLECGCLSLLFVPLCLCGCMCLAGCAAARPGTPLVRTGDEIVVCGQLFHTGTRVVLWTDPGGYDAYRVENRFDRPAFLKAALTAQSQSQGVAGGKAAAGAASAPAPDAPQPARYGSWRKHVPSYVLDEVWRSGWTLERLRDYVDLFVLHYDVCGTSQRCFDVLHDERHLSVHFMLDLDGTIYQTLDLKERAWHAGNANDRSVGVEIANIGAYPPPVTAELPGDVASAGDGISAVLTGAGVTSGTLPLPATLLKWYEHDAAGRVRARLPSTGAYPGVRTPGFIAYPARSVPVQGSIHGRELLQYDFTPEQYEALARLTATLSKVLPRIRIEFPRETDGSVAARVLSEDELRAFSGVLGHYHLTKQKIDPGPALDWEMLRREAQRALR